MRRALALVLLVCACGPTPADARPKSSVAASTPSVSSTSTAVAAWRRVADIPTPRSEVAAAVFRGTIYIVGGFGGGDVLETYVADRWSSGPRYPLPVDHAVAAAVEAGANPGVYVFGGNVNGVATARSFRLSADQGWQEIASMPAPRAQAAAVAMAGRVFVVGGAQGDRLVAPTYAYDVALDRWTTVAAIPTPRDHLAAVALDGRVCAVGGRRLSLLQNLAAFECYDAAADSWKTMPNAPTARGGLGAAVVAGRVYVAGGEQPLGTFKEVDVFDPVAGTWARGPELPTPRHGLGVVTVDGTLYVMSGGPTPGNSQTAVCEALAGGGVR
jgi:N-acetylneuraminic acid mutarotase